MALTDFEVRSAKARGRPYKMSDGGGLFLLVRPNGSKLWRLKYRYRGKEKLLSFGKYPTVGIAAARAHRAVAKGALAEGCEPIMQKDLQDFEASKTFKSVGTMWHRNRECSLDPAHAKRVWARLEKDVFPFLGSLMMDEISPPDVLAVIRRIEKRGALDVSRRAKQGIGQIFQFAIASGLCESDPTAHLRGALKPRPRVQHMAKLPLSELPGLLANVDSYAVEGDRRSAITSAALSFALLTWVRTKELRFAKRHEFEALDGDYPVWRISAGRMKMRREHIVPLSTQATSLVQELIAEASGEYVFPGLKPERPLSENTMIYGLYRMGYYSRQTVHGFRGLASTWANEQLLQVGEPPIWMRKYHEDWVELQLAHSERNEVRGAYNAAEYLMPRRLMMQDWADFLDINRAKASKNPVPAAAQF